MLKKGGNNLTFDLVNENGKFLYYLEIKKEEAYDAEVSEEIPNKKLKRKLDINVAHGYCHSSEAVLRKIIPRWELNWLVN